MLQHGNSDATVRLQRAKSTSSVPKRTISRKSIVVDPLLTYEDAVTAATRAYDKAQGHQQASSGSGNTTRTVNAALQRQGSHLARHRSGASAKGDRNESGTTVSHHSDKPGTRKTPMSTSQSTPVSQRTSTERSASVKEIEPRRVARPSQNNPPIIDLPETRIPEARSNLVYKVQPSQAVPRHQIGQVLKSLPSLPSENTTRLQAAREHQTDDAIIALARDKYLQERKSQNLKQGRSSVVVPFASRLWKPKKDSLQTESSADQDDFICEVENTRTENLADPSEARKTRRFSMTLKKGFMRAFRHTSRSSSSEMPLQQVEATRAHYGDPAFRSRRHESSVTSSDPLVSEEILDGEGMTLPRRFRDHNDSVVSERQSQQSLHSSYSASHPRSRVTSWDNSTRDNTMVLPDLEQLPSIVETAEPRKSPSLSSIHIRKSSAHGAVEVPLRRSSSKFSMNGAIDSRKLLSALKNQMKTARIRQKSSDARNVSGCTTESWNAACSSLPQATSLDAEPQEINHAQSFDVRAVASKYNYNPPSVAPPPRLLENTTSPSLYSENAAVMHLPNARGSQLLVKDHPINPTGTAVISETQPVARWSFEDGGTVSRRHVPNTSNEWRLWVAGEVAELDFSGLSSSAANNLKLGSEVVQSTDNSRNSGSRTAGGGNDSVGASSKGTLHRRRDTFHDPPALRTRRSENMNERFPMLSGGRKESKGSLTSSRQTSSSQQRELLRQNEPRLVQQRSRDVTGSNNAPTGVAGSEVSSDLPLGIRTSSIINASGAPNDASRVQQLAGRSMEGQEEKNSNPSAASRPKDTRSSPSHGKRMPVPAPAPLDDKFLRRIRKGPYGPPSSSPSKGNTSSIESFDMLASRKPYGGVRRGVENTPPSKGQRMVDEYLEGSSGRLDVPGGTSPAFL